MLKSLQLLLEKRPFIGDILVLLAGGLYPLAFSPFDAWPLAPLSLVVLILLVADVGTWRGALRFYLFALGLYGVGVSWIYVSIHEHGGASALLAGFLVLLFVAAFSLFSLVQGYLYMRFVRAAPLGLLLGFPVVWCVKEWACTWVLTGFPWLFAGYSAMDTWLVGYAPVIGVLGVGFIVALEASLVAWLLRGRRPPQLVAAMGILAMLQLGGLLLRHVTFVEPVGQPLTVSAVQGNIDQDLKWRRAMIEPILEKYVGLTRNEWGRDIVVWPEAAITLFRADAGDFLADMDARGKKTGTTLVLGIPDISPSGRFWNTAIAVGNGTGRYIKRHLVPFGEYVPLEGMLRGLIGFFDLPMSYNQPGPDTQAPLYAGKLRLSMSICYEVVYPELVRSTVANPDLLVTISNDTWFGHSIGPWQHFQMARMRAIENGRYMIRATNNGVTGIIDYRGRVTAELPQFESGVLRGKISEMSGQTPFSRYGQGPVLIVMALLLTLMLLGRVRHVPEQPIR